MVDWPCASYQTTKYVRIRDRKLGGMYYSMLLLIGLVLPSPPPRRDRRPAGR